MSYVITFDIWESLNYELFVSKTGIEFAYANTAKRFSTLVLALNKKSNPWNFLIYILEMKNVWFSKNFNIKILYREIF